MPALARTDVDNLLYPRVTQGTVRLRVANESLETDYLDYLAVLAVERPPPSRHQCCARWRGANSTAWSLLKRRSRLRTSRQGSAGPISPERWLGLGIQSHRP